MISSSTTRTATLAATTLVLCLGGTNALLFRPSIAAAKNVMQQTPGDWMVHQDVDLTRDLMAKAFASGEPVVDWLSRDLDIPTPSKDGADSQLRLDTYKFLMTFPVKDGLSQGGLVIGKGGCSDENSEMECGILFREYDPSIDGKKSMKKSIKTTVSSLATYFSMGKARKVGPFQGFFSKPTQAFFDKGSFYDSVSSNYHATYGPSSPHWYITAVGVDPASQGKGHGKKLMSQMGSLADQVGMDVYLECAGARNKGFYEKMGFVEVGLEYLDDGKGGDKQEIYLMIRPAKAVDTFGTTSAP